MKTRFPKNARAFEEEADMIVQVATERFMGIRETALNQDYQDRDGMWFVESGLVDPVNPFVKKEPHPERKFLDGSFRIICGVSLIDQIIDRLLFDNFAKVCKRLYPSLAATIGLGFHDDGIKTLVEMMEVRLGTSNERVSSDVEGFEKGSAEPVQIPVIEAFFARATNRRAHKPWLLMMLLRLRTLSKSVFAVNNQLIQKIVDGQQISGTFWTSYLNSFVRIYLAFNAKSENVAANGDDANELTHLDDVAMIQAYKALNVNLRDVQRYDGTFEFCSHRYYYNKTSRQHEASLENWAKCFYKMFSKSKIDFQQVFSVMQEIKYCNEDVKGKFAKLLSIAGANGVLVD